MSNIKNNSRLIIVQLLYSYYLNQEKLLNKSLLNEEKNINR